MDVVNDSELVARQVDGSYKVKNADLKGLHAAAREALAGFAALVDPLRAARGERGRRRAGQPRARRGRGRPGGAAAGSGGRGRHGLRELPADRRPAAAAAADHPGAHDELLFIVVHQAYELWFKLILHELTAVRDDLLAGRPHVAAPRLRRVVAIERLLLDQLDVLETMGPEGFLEFRDPLAPASGFQSRQFREIEWLSGERGTWPGGGDPPPGPALYDAFRAGLGLPEDDDDRLAALADLYRDHAGDPLRAAWHDVAELLVDHDERTALWRHHHTLMAAREIGTRMGTGGSRGVEYLRGTITRRYFPELWDVRLEI